MVSTTTRRQVLRDAAVVAGAGSALRLLPAGSARASRRRRPTVAVFGGGVAGLTAAHELAERGFAVSVYERRAWGGKARSTEVPGTATGGRRDLPGEHGYRIAFGFYQGLPDTMRRIPFGSNPNGVFDNLVAAPQLAFARTRKHDLVLPIGNLDPRPYTPTQILETLLAILVDMQLPPDAAAYFTRRLAVFLSSCDARRSGQWERTPWTDFIAAADYPEDYRKTFGEIPRWVQASKADTTSAKFVAWVFEMVIYSLLGLGSNGPCVRMLDGPTNEAWIDPWTALLRTHGVRLKLHHELTRFKLRGGRIESAVVRTPAGRRVVAADWFVCALPVERARSLWTKPMLHADPSLAEMAKLDTGWMNGVSFYLNTRPEIVNGDLFCADSPWAVSCVPQAQFWKRDFASTYGDGRAHEKLSAIIADWNEPGMFTRKTARDCTPDELTRELWEQIKAHVNTPGKRPTLTDDMLIATDIDPGMRPRNGRLVSDDPLVLPSVGTERHRPDVTTAIPNLLLSGDHLNGGWEVANMEAANHNGRRTANAILDRAKSTAPRVTTTPPYQPPEWEPLKRIDAARYRSGRPNLFDHELSPERLRIMLPGVRPEFARILAAP